MKKNINQIAELIQSINTACQIHFDDNNFYLQNNGGNKYIISGQGMTSALNHYGNDLPIIKVLKWFDDFWIYISILFSLRNQGEFPDTSLSISIFQGEENDEKKNQLFRAEWDNYENNLFHPQPHWHIYPHKWHHKVYDSVQEFFESKEQTVKNTVEQEFHIIDITKIHFAMNGNWTIKPGGAIHKLLNPELISNWMQGVLGEIKTQLKFAKENK